MHTVTTIVSTLRNIIANILCWSEHKPAVIYSLLWQALHRAVREDEMPMRMAYEQLDELAANAERVKFAIERNRSLLTLQVLRCLLLRQH